MEQPAMRKYFLAIVVIFTVMAVLLITAPVYAAGPGHEPPPPKPPTNDLGKKDKPDKSPPHPAVDLPGDTSLVVTNNGTPLPLASLLSAKAISASSPAKPVKFCKNSNPSFYGDCKSYASIEDAINAVAWMDESPSGVFYVALNYPKPEIMQGPAIVIDQHDFYNPDGEAKLDMLGGYIFSGAGAGTQSKHPTELIRPINILNFNENSSFSMDNFDIYMWALMDDYLAPDYNPADIHVTDSHNVSLSDLTITSWSTAWSGVIDIENSEHVTLNGIVITQYSVGSGISINQSSGIRLKDISIDVGYMSGISIYDSGLRADADYPPEKKNTWDPSITLDNVFVNACCSGNGVGVFNSDHVLIKNSTFIVHIGDLVYTDPYPYAAVETGSAEYITLDNVIARGNDRGDGIWISDTYNTRMNHVNANSTDYHGASIDWGGGSIEIKNSHFDDNGMNGLYVERIDGDLTLDNVTANGNASYGFTAYTPRSVNVFNSRFNGNGDGGMIVAGGSLVRLSGVQADHNGSFGAALFNAGGFLSSAQQFPSIDFGDYSSMYLADYPGDLQVQDSSFSDNESWGLKAVFVPLTFPYNESVDRGSFITFNNVTANNNGDYGISASITSSSDDPFENGNVISLNNVTANHNALSGVFLSADTIKVLNSAFMFNSEFGLELVGVVSSLRDVRACNNGYGSEIHNGDLFTTNFDTQNCPEEGAGAGTGTETPATERQIVNAYLDSGKSIGTLSCQFGTTFQYLEKTDASDFEWAHVELASCLVPGGTIGTMTGLDQGALPGPLPDGVTFLGKAFDFELSGANGSPVSLGGAMNVRFSLPAGFSLPSGKKLAILWFDPTAKQWVELTTYAGGGYANAYTSKTGAFVLVLK